MCPDRQLLSVYFDGELPSPWKEKLERHLSGCPSCAGKLESYKALSLGSAADEAAVSAAQERVWRAMQGRFNPAPLTLRRSGGLWRRRISIPVPAAAAAALLLIVFALAWVIRAPAAGETQAMPLISESDYEPPGLFPFSDMGEILQYLGAWDGGESVMIRLPDSSSFVSYGEPAIIRAADYPRQSAGRRRP